jgi:hypothetical protein
MDNEPITNAEAQERMSRTSCHCGSIGFDVVVVYTVGPPYHKYLVVLC